MGVFLRIIAILALVSPAFFASSANAGFYEWARKNRERLVSFPQCDDAKVIKKIVERFNWAEEHTWQRGYQLETVERNRQRSTHSHGTIERRYCRGHAILSNGRHPTVHYLIERGQGFAGTGFNVEFCVDGHDEWRTYNGSCRVLRH